MRVYVLYILCLVIRPRNAWYMASQKEAIIYAWSKYAKSVNLAVNSLKKTRTIWFGKLSSIYKIIYLFSSRRLCAIFNKKINCFCGALTKELPHFVLVLGHSALIRDCFAFKNIEHIYLPWLSQGLPATSITSSIDSS